MKISIAIALLSLPLLARDAALSIPFPGGADKIEYDDTKFSESEIRTIFTRLSPELAPFYGYMIPNPLELCVDEDKHYEDCGSRDINSPNILNNAEVNVRLSEQKLSELRDTTAPAELEPVQKYLEEFLRVGLRMQKCQLEYYKTGSAAGLKACDSLEGAPECNILVKKIADANDPSEKHKLAQYDWDKCIVKHTNERLGPYPEQTWKKFLEAYGLKETVWEDND
jgi:hypothetical protein